MVQTCSPGPDPEEGAVKQDKTKAESIKHWKHLAQGESTDPWQRYS